MSPKESLISTPTPEFPPHVPILDSVLDSEMTCSLTSNGNSSTRSRSCSPKQIDMSSFNGARDRNDRLNGGRRPSVNGRQNTGQNWSYEAASPTPRQVNHQEYNPH